VKILFFSPYFYPYISGITISPKRILDHLKKNGDITVLTFPHNNKLSKGENINKLNIIRMPYLFKISKGFISPQSLIYFYKYAKESDLIILNQPNFEGLFLAIIAKIFRRKIVSIFHCQVFLEGSLLTKIINFTLNTSMIIQLRLSDKIVVYTKDYINSLSYFKKFTNKTFEILPPIEESVSDKKLLTKLLKLKKNDILIGYAGRISSEKGLEYLLQSIDRLDKLKKNIKLVFAGPYGKDVVGENQYYNKIITMLNKYKIKHIFLGNLTSEQLSAFYKSIDVLVLPSINQTEAFGMVQAEAMLAGTPVIASNLPGVRVPIKLTKMGKIVEPKNSEQLSQAILEILKNKNKFVNNKLIKNAQEIFDINKVYKFYENLLNNEI
jgi:glycosyltransferase involved in cell wall biosynthesis